MSDPLASSAQDSKYEKRKTPDPEPGIKPEPTPATKPPRPKRAPNHNAWTRAYLDTPALLLLLYPFWLGAERYLGLTLNLSILTLAASAIAGRRWGLRALPALMVLGMPFLLGWTQSTFSTVVTTGEFWTIAAMVLVFRLTSAPEAFGEISNRRWTITDWIILLALCVAGSVTTKAFSIDDVLLLEQLDAEQVFKAVIHLRPESNLLPVLMIVLGMLQAPRGPVMACLAAGLICAVALSPFWPVPTSYAVYLTAFPGLWPSDFLTLALIFLATHKFIQLRRTHQTQTSHRMYVLVMQYLLVPALFLMCIGFEFTVNLAQSQRPFWTFGKDVSGPFVQFWTVFAATLLVMTSSQRRPVVSVIAMSVQAGVLLVVLFSIEGLVPSGNNWTSRSITMMQQGFTLFGTNGRLADLGPTTVFSISDIFSIRWRPHMPLADLAFSAVLQAVGVVWAYRAWGKFSAGFVGPAQGTETVPPGGYLHGLIGSAFGWLAIGVMVFNLTFVGVANWFIENAEDIEAVELVSQSQLEDQLTRFNDVVSLVRKIQQSTSKGDAEAIDFEGVIKLFKSNLELIGASQTALQDAQTEQVRNGVMRSLNSFYEVNETLLEQLEGLVREEALRLNFNQEQRSAD
ncbi:hypothetical protein ASD8599_01505 [Ascidiaceihabitans donghaensis]|uniref:Uncharacterized protein n=1 Tax=Ascidiaceihabitans donghaensis TaxID=1510460 RepID=A0A2R8BCG8_9RHOB|nr:hypothetical protein [Ascidiaceihabitans donghaensis]SPH20764.1 hypothetical protein ASD8599_01505 [Ascidiaceihabitans donghaensis]